MIRPAASHDFAAIARLHSEAIPRGFLSRLGGPLLTELYRSLASQPGTCVLVAVDEQDHCYGFVAGTAHTQGLFQRVLYGRWYRFAALAGRSLLSPANLKSAAETVLYGLRGRRELGSAQVGAELLSMAVATERRGTGRGKALVRALESFLAEHGASEFKVVTAAGDPGANAFYPSCGFGSPKRFKHHDVLMNEYVKAIRST